MKTLLLIAVFSPAMLELPSFQFKQEKEIVVVHPQRPIEWVQMIEIVKESEGFRAEPYLCPAGVVTIGYGHTATAKQLDAVTQSEAHKLLMADLKKAEAHVDRIVTVPLDDGQKACLVSFTFNCGQGNLKQLVSGPDRLNSGNYNSVNKILPLYRMGGGKVLKGLEIRRAKELTLWRSSDTMLASIQ